MKTLHRWIDGRGGEFVHFSRDMIRPEFTRIEFVETNGNRSDALLRPESAEAIYTHWQRIGFAPLPQEIF